MKAIKILGILVILLSTLESCSTKQVTASNERSGVQLWGENCIRCHNTPSPASYNDTDWSTIGLHMQVRANLTKEDSDKIFAFIKSAN